MTDSLRMLLQLTRLELRRNLGGGMLLLMAGLLLWLVTSEAPTPAQWLDLEVAPEDGGQALRGLTRARAWSLVLLGLLPLAMLRAAGTATRWRAGEGDWLGSAPLGRGVALTGTWLGITSAGTLFLAAAALGIEGVAGAGDQPGWQPVDALRAERSQLVRPWGKPVELDLSRWNDLAREGDELRVRVALTLMPPGMQLGQPGPEGAALLDDHATQPGGQAATAEWRLSRGAGSSKSSLSVRNRGWLSLEVPAGEGVLDNRLINRGPGALALLAPEGVELWRLGSSERSASWRLATYACLWLGSLVALALGLGFWMRAGTAALLTGSLLLWAANLPEPWAFPGAALLQALEHLETGRLPALPAGHDAIAAAGWVLIALLIAAAGCRSWRHPR